jgi:predicted CoA-binding protein
VTDADQILEATHSVLLVDWPSKDVPEALARAGLTVVVKGGPEPDNYSAYEVEDGEVVTRRVGRPPEHVDLVYSYRPLEELPGIVGTADMLGAKVVWCQSGLASSGAHDPLGCWVPDDTSQAARRIVEAAGLAYIDSTYIADAVRRLATERSRAPS